MRLGAFVVLLLLLATTAQGQTYFPMGDSYAWYYESLNDVWDLSERGDAYALDHGEVQYLDVGGALFALHEFGFITAAAVESWGLLKARFEP